MRRTDPLKIVIFHFLEKLRPWSLKFKSPFPELKKMNFLKIFQIPTLRVIWGEKNEKKHARPIKHHLEVELFNFQNTEFFNFSLKNDQF